MESYEKPPNFSCLAILFRIPVSTLVGAGRVSTTALAGYPVCAGAALAGLVKSVKAGVFLAAVEVAARLVPRAPCVFA